MTSQTVLAKKRRGPAPTGKGQQVVVRFQPDALAQLDAWIALTAEPKPSRPEAVRRLVAERLGEAKPTAATNAEQIKAQEEKIGALPSADAEPSPEAAMNVMRRAVAENDLKELNKVRRKTRKPGR